MRNEQGKALAQCQKYDIIGINNTHWDESCDWCAMVDAYKLFRGDKKGRQSRGMASFITEGQECMQLTTGNNRVETLWVKIKVQTNNVDVIMGVGYRSYRHNNDINSSSNQGTPSNFSLWGNSTCQMLTPRSWHSPRDS